MIKEVVGKIHDRRLVQYAKNLIHDSINYPIIYSIITLTIWINKELVVPVSGAGRGGGGPALCPRDLGPCARPNNAATNSLLTQRIHDMIECCICF